MCASCWFLLHNITMHSSENVKFSGMNLLKIQ